MSLRTKLLAVVVGLYGLTLLVVLLFLLRTEGGTPPSALAYLLHSRLSQVEAHLARWDPYVDRVWLVEERTLVQLDRGDLPSADDYYQVYDARAWFRAPPSQRPDPLPEGPETAAAVEAWRRARSGDGRVATGDRVVSMLEVPPEARSRLGIVAEVRDPGHSTRVVYVIMLAGLLLLGLVVYRLLSHLVIRPLARLTEAAGAMASGADDVRLPEDGRTDELGRTTRAFNRMAAEIAEYQQHLETRVLAALSQIKSAERHLAVAQRLAATGTLAAGIAHEINNPLGGMKNAVRALLRGDLSPEKTSEYLDLIGEGLARIEETVKKVLSFTPRRVEPRPVDLAEVARKALALARHRIERKSIRVEGHAPSEHDARVFGDPLELQQVALNLLLNAADAVDERVGGRITVRVEPRGEGEVVLSVADDGAGMTPEEQARCFDLFYTTKPAGEGTGLGLSVVHNIVSNHGGRVEVESAKGRGTTFRVILPRELPTPEEPGSAPALPDPAVTRP